MGKKEVFDKYIAPHRWQDAEDRFKPVPPIDQDPEAERFYFQGWRGYETWVKLWHCLGIQPKHRDGEGNEIENTGKAEAVVEEASEATEVEGTTNDQGISPTETGTEPEPAILKEDAAESEIQSEESETEQPQVAEEAKTADDHGKVARGENQAASIAARTGEGKEIIEAAKTKLVKASSGTVRQTKAGGQKARPRKTKKAKKVGQVELVGRRARKLKSSDQNVTDPDDKPTRQKR